MKYAIVDIETTGGNHKTGRITEIAIVLHDGHEVEGHYETLVNPEEIIPPFITQLTGIHNHMVDDAPLYGDVAWMLKNLLSDRIFVAHNVQFDYRFVQMEFNRLGVKYVSDHLCTIRSSRNIFPGLKSYSLGKLCDSLGIDLENRHRAAGDAMATAELFSLMHKKAGRSLYRHVVQAEPVPYI